MKKLALCLFWFCIISLLECFGRNLPQRALYHLQRFGPTLHKMSKGQCRSLLHQFGSKFFKTGWSKPLEIYYSRNHSETFKLLCKHGHNHKGSIVKARSSYYITKTQTIYTHQYYDNKRLVGIDVLFHEITHHFVRLNFPNVPTWFNEGLASFFRYRNAES